MIEEDKSCLIVSHNCRVFPEILLKAFGSEKELRETPGIGDLIETGYCKIIDFKPGSPCIKLLCGSPFRYYKKFGEITAGVQDNRILLSTEHSCSWEEGREEEFSKCLKRFIDSAESFGYLRGQPPSRIMEPLKRLEKEAKEAKEAAET